MEYLIVLEHKLLQDGLLHIELPEKTENQEKMDLVLNLFIVYFHINLIDMFLKIGMNNNMIWETNFFHQK